MIKLDSIYGEYGKIICDICGREQSIDTFVEHPDGWTIIADSGKIIDICYDPDCKETISRIFMNETRCSDE